MTRPVSNRSADRSASRFSDGEADRREFSEERASLWRITLAPSIWAVHFAASYGFAAIWCARLADGLGDTAPMRLWIGAGTVLAAGLIFWLGWQAWVQWNLKGQGQHVHDRARPGDRHRFLGHAAFLLALVSLIGVVYTSLPVLLIETCV